MPRSILSLVRRNLLGLAAIAFVAVPSSFALASTARSTTEKPTRFCVASKTGVMRYVAPAGRCRSGERSLLVNLRGDQGVRGVAGLTGVRGATGADGTVGNSGAAGAMGLAGMPGLAGGPGSPGAAGTNGAPGTPGSNGSIGTPGLAGTNGTTGTPGIDGSNGTPGLAGTNGTAGTAGASGLQGNTGADGGAGPQGTAGAAGGIGPQGIPGADGSIGPRGNAGADGGTGPQGTAGAAGGIGPQGTAGATGGIGQQGTAGAAGGTGPQGTAGAAGAQGPAGPVSTLQFAEFYARMPADNAATVASGSRLLFPQTGPTQGAIVRQTTSEFLLTNAGTYKIEFAASITEAGQLQLAVNGVGVPWAVFGRATGTSLIAGGALIATSPGDIVSIVNASAGVVTLTPLAGGPTPVTAYVIIQQLS